VQELIRHAKLNTTMELDTHDARMHKKREAQSRAVDLVSIWRRIAAVEGLTGVCALCSPAYAGLCQL
jgi:hypothetical protein